MQPAIVADKSNQHGRVIPVWSNDVEFPISVILSSVLMRENKGGREYIIWSATQEIPIRISTWMKQHSQYTSLFQRRGEK